MTSGIRLLRRPSSLLPATAFLGLALASSTASAHLDLNYPAMRGGNQKAGPCEGVSAAGAPNTVLAPGAQITVDILETIGHPGHYRIMFDADTTDGEDFPDPATCDDVGTPDGITLLGDYLLPAQGGTCDGFHTPSERTVASNVAYQFDITLPDVECENCALQVIQVMTDASKADADGNWVSAGGRGLYFRCANLTLTNNPNTDPDPGTDPDPDTDPDPGTDPDPDTDNPPAGTVSGACSAAGSGAGSSAVLSLLAIFLVVARRRRSRA